MLFEDVDEMFSKFKHKATLYPTSSNIVFKREADMLHDLHPIIKATLI